MGVMNSPVRFNPLKRSLVQYLTNYSVKGSISVTRVKGIIALCDQVLRLGKGSFIITSGIALEELKGRSLARSAKSRFNRG